MAGLQKHLEGKYEVLGGLEDGPGGDVYKVRHLFLDEVRLIRVVHLPGAPGSAAGEELLRAARAAIRLRHPNIAQLHDFFLEDDGSAVMIGELVDGPTLEEILEDLGPLPPGLALEIAQQALHGLGHLHRNGVAPGDVSPDKLRITLDANGRPLVKWVDLGLGGILAAGDGFSSGGMFPAKPRYAAPERFSAAGGPGDARSDLYSFGIVLCEMLTGRCPIPGHDAFSYMAGHLSAPPLDFSQSDPDTRLPPELRAVLRQSLEKRPEDRVSSADELSRQLAAVQPLLPSPGAAATEHLERALKIARQRSGLRAPADLHRTVALPPAAAGGAATQILPPPPPATLRPAPPTPPIAPAPAGGEDAWADRTLGYSTVVRSPLAAAPPLSPAPPVPGPSPAPPPEAGSRSKAWLPGAAALLLLLLLGGAWLGLRGRSSSGTRGVAAPQEEPPAAPSSEATEPGETVDIGDVPLPPAIEEDATTRSSPPLSALGDERRRTAPPTAEASDPGRATTAPPEVPGERPAQGPMQRGDLITGGPGVEYAEPVSIGQAVYPAAARGTGKSARVRVAVLVDENGNVIQARIKESDTPGYGFNDAALGAARRARFLPATRDGIPGKSWTEVQYELDPPAAPPVEPPLDTKPFETVPPPVSPP